MKVRVSFVIDDTDALTKAEMFVDDSTKDGEGEAVVSWNDIEGDEHEWQVHEVKYEVL